MRWQAVKSFACFLLSSRILMSSWEISRHWSLYLRAHPIFLMDLEGLCQDDHADSQSDSYPVREKVKDSSDWCWSHIRSSLLSYASVSFYLIGVCMMTDKITIAHVGIFLGCSQTFSVFDFNIGAFVAISGVKMIWWHIISHMETHGVLAWLWSRWWRTLCMKISHGPYSSRKGTYTVNCPIAWFFNSSDSHLRHLFNEWVLHNFTVFKRF